MICIIVMNHERRSGLVWFGSDFKPNYKKGMSSDKSNYTTVKHRSINIIFVDKYSSPGTDSTQLSLYQIEVTRRTSVI